MKRRAGRWIAGVGMATMLWCAGCAPSNGVTADGPVVAPSAYRAVPDSRPAAEGTDAAGVVMRGRGAAARVESADGRLLLSGSMAAPVFSARGSPDGRHVLVDLGNADHAVIAVEDGATVARLPRAPQGVADATGFGAWEWLDAAHLVGQADIPAAAADGLTAAEEDALPAERSLLYVYGLDGGGLAPVALDGGLPRAFSLGRAADWRVELIDVTTDVPAAARIVPAPRGP